MLNNHVINNARALLFASILLDIEFYSDLAFAILRSNLPELVSNDGFLREGSSHYQFIFTRWILEMLWLSKISNKYGITLDIEKPRGVELFHQLLAEADVLVENYPPSETDRIGISYGTLKDTYPGLIVTSITPFGQTGPYRNYKAYDINISAAGGMSYGTGIPDREPLTTPLQQSSHLGGYAAAVATMMALMSCSPEKQTATVRPYWSMSLGSQVTI